MNKNKLLDRGFLSSLYADFRRKGNFTAAGETQYEVSRTPEKQRFLTTWLVMTPFEDSP